MKNNQKGQLILTLILVMATALVIGLSVIQRSLTDVSTSTKVEQSSRAFSAAEAGIEQYLGSNTNCTPDTCKVEFSDIGSKAAVEGGGLIPLQAQAGQRQDPLEFPFLAKEEVAQVWLADPTSNLPICDASRVCYKQTSLDIYWGNSQSERPAIELTFVYYSSGQYLSEKRYFEPDSARVAQNNFTPVTCSGDNPLGRNNYQCYSFVSGLPAGLMLVRARLLYNDASSQLFAVQATGICGPECSLPRQARVLTSTGSSGETARKVQLFQSVDVVPPYFNYAIFSAGEIEK